MADADAAIVRKALMSVWQLVVAPIIVTGLLGLAGWIWYVDRTTAVHGNRIETLEKATSRIDDKLDRILERLGAN